MVDVQRYTENCLGLTGWTTGFHVALRSLQRNMLQPFRDLATKVEEVVEGETAVAIRLRLEGTHVGEFLGIAPRGRRVA